MRPEMSGDRAVVRQLNELAFGGSVEADLVEALHREGAACLALVAEVEGKVVGHIMFSPVEIDHAPARRVVGLGPMAVTPSHQRRGVGGQLVTLGLARLRGAGVGGVVVVGHPTYYTRFGFVPADSFGLRCEYDVPREVFMAKELYASSLKAASGLVRYHPAFSRA